MMDGLTLASTALLKARPATDSARHSKRLPVPNWI